GLTILLVRVETEDGTSGWGEGFSYNCMPALKAAVDATVAPIVIGRDATEVTAINRDLQQALHLFGSYGITMFAISAIDIALWDLAGKRAGLPLGQLLGGPAALPLVPGYASLLKYRDRELVAQTVRDAVEEGYPAIKLHETGEAEIAAAREAMGAEMPLCTDTNCPWTPAEAGAMAARLKPYDLHWLEEPIFPPEDFGALARLQQESGIDLACGENACTAFEFRRMLEAGAVRYVQPSVTKVGGVTEFLKVLAVAEGYSVTVMPHSPYFGPGWLATLQLLGAMPLTGRPGGGWAERFYTRLEATLYPGLVSPAENGHFRIPAGPGLGAEPDPDVIRDYRVPA
ncbi:MAG: mandelate racemase/muconate lactonizing enzyme family protein, partial [Alphaproteobacteria bacterium]|nr:mandelate racemase/muconate lactonizing enzyme family protein [Alphaproteobacteria bacterium]